MTAADAQLVRNYASPQYLDPGKALHRMVLMQARGCLNSRAWRSLGVRLDVAGLKRLANRCYQVANRLALALAH